ncbi:MAG: hypothetical protein K6E94_05295 [Elusimicrobiaceae bacterium]|nr:hypothetical protein [Elusimicrobiaceae bacterium]
MKVKYIIIIILSVGLFCLLISMERVQKGRTGHKVGEMLEAINFKEARNQYLRYEISCYKSPSQITEEAEKKNLQVIKPQNVYLVESKSE